MSEKIIVDIDCEGEYCGKCQFLKKLNFIAYCDAFNAIFGEYTLEKCTVLRVKRCPECIASSEQAKRAIVPKYDIGLKIWSIGKYKLKQKICRECGQPKPFVRYRVLPKTEIMEIKVAASVFYGRVIIYESNTLVFAKESEIDCYGGIWFTSPESAQSECDRRNAELRGADKT